MSKSPSAQYRALLSYGNESISPPFVFRSVSELTPYRAHVDVTLVDLDCQ